MVNLTELNKKLKGNNKAYWFVREQYVVWYSRLARIFDKPVANSKKRILFYHVSGLGFAGTEKFLQILAKHLNKEKYDVFFLYPNTLEANPKFKERLDYLKAGNVIGLPFNYKKVRATPPYFVEGMNPDIKILIEAYSIDLLVVADSGHANYPFSIIKNVPIILLNIFGQPNIQKNIKFHVCISQEVGEKLKPIVPDNKIKVYPVPSEGPFENSTELGKAIRERFNIKDTDTVFGRIGRADNGIYDPIGINAFKKALLTRDDIHYIIMCPAPILVEKVENEKIKNVHFLAPSANEADVWVFHASIDTLAHFRNDGESFGLNIAESMLSAKPIITHKSHIWNAHLEYLDESFARIAEKDDSDTYSKFMLEYADKKAAGELAKMGVSAKTKAEKLFLVKNIIGEFESWVEVSLR